MVASKWYTNLFTCLQCLYKTYEIHRFQGSLIPCGHTHLEDPGSGCLIRDQTRDSQLGPKTEGLVGMAPLEDLGVGANLGRSGCPGSSCDNLFVGGIPTPLNMLRDLTNMLKW